MTDQKQLYRTLSLIRHAEQKIFDVYMSDVMQCPVHLSIGEESIATSLCAHLKSDDLKIGTHRCHALYLANGGDLKAFFGELLGRACGCSGGHGGSMHLMDMEHGLVGTTSIVGGAIPIVVGLAMARKRPNLGAALFGDGACDEGVFAESINYAQLRKAPVIFCCENNRYSVYTHERQRRVVKPAAVAKAFGLTTIEVPIEVANDVFTLSDLLAEPIQKVRDGAGPLFIECQTVRRFDHNGVRDDVAAGFRDAYESELFERYCPMKLARSRMLTDQVEAIDAEVRQQIEQAYAAAMESEEVLLEYRHA